MVKTGARHKGTEAVWNDGWRLAAVGGWRLAVGGWRLAAVGGWRLAVGGWWSLGAVLKGCPEQKKPLRTALGREWWGA